MMKINPSHEIVAWAYCQTWDSELTYEEHHEALVQYLLAKVEVQDWHGVSDAANDLRVLEAEHAKQKTSA